MTTRRALLGAGLAGGAALLTGCGPSEEPAVVAADVLGDQLRAEQAAVRGYDGLPALVDPSARPVVERMAARTRARARRLERAVRQAGGTPGAPPPAPASPGLESALALEREALAAHVQGIGLLGEREWRELLSDLVANAAQHESALLTLLERPPLSTAFPGTPAR